jgi:hypothetical protein
MLKCKNLSMCRDFYAIKIVPPKIHPTTPIQNRKDDLGNVEETALLTAFDVVRMLEVLAVIVCIVTTVVVNVLCVKPDKLLLAERLGSALTDDAIFDCVDKTLVVAWASGKTMPSNEDGSGGEGVCRELVDRSAADSSTDTLVSEDDRAAGDPRMVSVA